MSRGNNASKSVESGYLCYWENGITEESSPQPKPYYSFALIISKIKILFKVPNSYIGVIDSHQNTIQFNIFSTTEIYLNIPQPKRQGFFSKKCSLEEAISIIEKHLDDFSSLKVDGVEFVKWNPGPDLPSEDEKPLLTFKVNGHVYFRISNSQLPCEKKPSVNLEENAFIEFVDHKGKTIRHQLGAEKGWYHFCIRVYENYACQADCLITQTEILDESALDNGANGIRFQPFFISGSKTKEDFFIGKGLFIRGLHYNGRVTNSRIALSGVCDFCLKSFLFHSFHAGFSNAGYFYSESGEYTLTVSDNVPGCPIPLTKPDPKELTALENKLPKAPDGTRYLYKNPFRCPHCQKPYIDFEKHPAEREAEYYGNYFEQTKVSRFET